MIITVLGSAKNKIAVNQSEKLRLPVLGNNLISGNNKPVIPKKPEKEKWNFSFKYFNQIEYFGCKGIDGSWFISLLDRLRELSDIHPEDFFQDRNAKSAWRYHEINWESQNIPIKKTDLHWIDKEYLSNNEEFPFFQFRISKAKGRIVGFWGSDHKVFYLVLLDPLHNIQPAGGKFNYRVDDCSPLSCQYTSLTKDIDDIKQKPCVVEGCKVFPKIMELPKRMNDTNAVVAYLDDDTLEELNKVLAKKSISDILMAGIMSDL